MGEGKGSLWLKKKEKDKRKRPSEQVWTKDKGYDEDVCVTHTIRNTNAHPHTRAAVGTEDFTRLRQRQRACAKCEVQQATK